MTEVSRRRGDNLGKALVKRNETNRSNRTVFESLWQEIARFCIPEEATFTEEVSPGVQRNRSILDSTAPRSLERFASFIHTLMNNPSLQWFKVKPAVPAEIAESVEVKQWVEDVEKAMLQAMAAPGSNTYNTFFAIYLALGSFGTGAMFVDAPDGKLRTQSFHLGDVVIEEDFSGNVDVVLRQRKYTLRQAKQRWPGLPEEAFGPSFTRRDKLHADEPVMMLHAILPAADPMLENLTKKDKARVEGAPSVGIWINVPDQITIAVNPFFEHPYMTPRWYKARGEAYGRSPAMTVLPDIRMVNRMMETILRGAEKLVDPPLLLPDGSLVTPVRLFPGGVTFTEGEVKPQPLIPPGASRVEYGQALLESRQQAITDGFFIPLFATPDSPVKTATQVLQETDERNRALSPMLVRQQSEIFHRFIERVYGLLSRAGQLPPPPPSLAGVPLIIEYVSPLSASQHQMEALGTMRIIEGLLPWAQLDPTVFDPFDIEDVARVVHRGSGAPASILLPSAKVKAKKEARAEQAALEAQRESLTGAVEATAKAAGGQAALIKANKA